MNPATALATVLVDELLRCGLREAVIAPGSRSAPLALALFDASTGVGRLAGDRRPEVRGPEVQGPEVQGPEARRPEAGRPGLRLHVRIDERSAAFLALGLAKASGRPVAVVCTSGTAAAHFHAAVIEADESAVPLLVLTADRPPELRGTGANQTIDQLKLYGGAVRWFCEAGVPEARAGQTGYWRSIACRAWATAAGGAGGLPGPVHLNLPFREPLVPDSSAGSAADGAADDWPGSLDGRPGGAPWTTFSVPAPTTAGPGSGTPANVAATSAAQANVAATSAGLASAGEASPGPGSGAVAGVTAGTVGAEPLELPWTERGVVICGDGVDDPAGLARLAEAAGWPLLAEPSSGTRLGATVVPAYQYLLDSAEFLAAHRPDLIVSAGRPGLSRGQLAFLEPPADGPPVRHVIVTGGGGRWADPARSATDVAAAVRLRGAPEGSIATAGGTAPAGATAPLDCPWLASWLAAGAAARRAADAVLEEGDELSEPRLARDLAALLPEGALLWVASSLPIRDLDRHMAPRPGLRVMASRGASGIDGLVSSAIGAALAHQAAGGGPAVALLGDLAVVHDAAGLMLGPDEPRPDLCLIVVNNDGGGIFSGLEQAAFPAPFERVFGTPHGTDLRLLAGAAKLRYSTISRAADLPAAVSDGGSGRTSGSGASGGGASGRGGLRLVEVRTDRDAGAALRARIGRSCRAQLMRTRGSSTA
jgi:2-succinyl-5-enolpyruvyl-6-hydroxy-3-cyclohexene-1-carboxylate synthase